MAKMARTRSERHLHAAGSRSGGCRARTRSPGGRSRSGSEIRPNSVSAPVRTTRSRGRAADDARAQEEAVRSAGRAARPAGSAPAAFSTGKVSPVRAASSTKRSFASRMRPSPGIMSPALSSTTSPGTTSSTGTSTGRPSRRTVARTWTRASSFSTASAAPHSCQKPSRPLTRTMARMIRASVASPEEERQGGRDEQDQDDRAPELGDQEGESPGRSSPRWCREGPPESLSGPPHP